MRKQKGMAALMMTITVLSVATIIALFSASVIVIDNRIHKNVKNNMDALNAAQAGFDYALGYLNTYPYIILNGLSYCSASSPLNTYTLASSGALTNGSTYTMTFSCFAQNNLTTLYLVATGTSQDGSATRNINATLMQYCGGSGVPITSKGNVNLSGLIVAVSNPDVNATRTIVAGGTIGLSNFTFATTATGGTYSCAGSYHTPPSISSGSCRNLRSSNSTPSNAALSAMSDTNFQKLYLGRQIAGAAPSFESLATVYNIDCTSSGNKIFDSVADTFASQGCTGTGSGTALYNITNAIIYMNMANRSLTLTTPNSTALALGTATAPVILVVNSTSGNVTITSASGGSLTVYGNIYATTDTLSITQNAFGNTLVNGLVFGLNDVNITANARVSGAVIAGDVDMLGLFAAPVTLNSTNINHTYLGYCGGMYSIAPGSRRDF